VDDRRVEHVASVYPSARVSEGPHAGVCGDARAHFDSCMLHAALLPALLPALSFEKSNRGTGVSEYTGRKIWLETTKGLNTCVQGVLTHQFGMAHLTLDMRANLLILLAAALALAHIAFAGTFPNCEPKNSPLRMFRLSSGGSSA